VKILLIELLLIALFGGVFPVSAQSKESGWNEVGVRLGFQATTKREYLRQYDVFAVYGLPWDARHDSGWGVTPNVNFSLGILDGTGEPNFIGSAGTALVLNKKGPGLSTDLGINANLLNKRHFGTRDFGSILQFGAYIGVYYRLDSGIKIGYRLQHISNGHIFYPNGTPNPGLDLHIIGVSYVF
jgi:hypothetical protein